MDKKYVRPFLKWAGGKYRLLPQLLDKFPSDAPRLIEPFLGAAAISLNTNYPIHIVNDVNKDLINIWLNLREQGDIFIENCEKSFTQDNNNRDKFNYFREIFNNINDDYIKSNLFIYLNRHCFNGLCRYNNKGFFNVPFGKYNKPYFPRKEMEQAFVKISNWQIYNEDFRKIFSLAKEGDLIYCDPPYIPSSITASFSKYSTNDFNIKDHQDLAECANNASKLGATVIISNSLTLTTEEIYIKKYQPQVDIINASRVIGVKNRGSVKEYLIMYKG